MVRIPEGRFFVWHNFTFLVIYEWKNNLGSLGLGGGIWLNPKPYSKKFQT